MANETTETKTVETETKPAETQEPVETKAEQPTDISAEVARLKRELAAQINKNDSLAKENAEQKKAIRAKQSAEEAAAEEAKEAAEAQAKELAELRKKFAVAETGKKVLAFVGDEQTANAVAEYLYGAEDVDGVLDALNKAWKNKEKALRLEFGKIQAPGVGSGEGPTMTREQLNALPMAEAVKFANEHPQEYAKLMGR